MARVSCAAFKPIYIVIMKIMQATLATPTAASIAGSPSRPANTELVVTMKNESTFYAIPGMASCMKHFSISLVVGSLFIAKMPSLFSKPYVVLVVV